MYFYILSNDTLSFITYTILISCPNKGEVFDKSLQLKRFGKFFKLGTCDFPLHRWDRFGFCLKT